jgi:uncharacterized protein
VLDPVHGLIRLTELEVAVIDHPLFQRLRKIKQNGLLYLVFPSATHTRFEHSLGALHTADAMIEATWLNSAVAARKGTVVHVDSDRDDTAIDISQLVPARIESLARITRLAALVHDLGHGPFSHTFDSFAPRRDAIIGLLSSPELASLRPLAEILRSWPERPGGTNQSADDRVPHEVMSCVFFARIWAALTSVQRGDAESDMPLVVAAALLGTDEARAAVADPAVRQWIPFVHDVVASAPADADRMDYLRRDSLSVGVSYGFFDVHRVLKTLLCYRSAKPGGDRVYRLGLKRSGLPAVENLVQARYEMFVQVYFHKTNAAISLMLDQIAIRAREADGFEVLPISNLDALCRRYEELSDDYFMRVLKGLEVGGAVPPAGMCVIAIDIDRRRLWKRIFETSSPTLINEVLEAIRSARVPGWEHLILDPSVPKATKDLDKGAALMERDTDEIYVRRGSTWLKESPIIAGLWEAEKGSSRAHRLYLTRADLGFATDLRRRAKQAELAIKSENKGIDGTSH